MRDSNKLNSKQLHENTSLLATLHEHSENEELFANIIEEEGFPTTMPWEPKADSDTLYGNVFGALECATFS